MEIWDVKNSSGFGRHLRADVFRRGGQKVKPEPEPVGCTAISGKKCMAAPEIDPSSAVAGLTLLAGGLAVMLGRRSKRLQTQAE